MKPTIGLNCDLTLCDGRPKLEIWQSYTMAVELAGGTPVLLPATGNPGHIDEQFDLIDGLVLIGGKDYDPELYGAARHEKTETVHPARQFYDLELARAAIRRKVPILAICGGCQLVNIVCGGDLVQHLPDALDAAETHAGQPDALDAAETHAGQPDALDAAETHAGQPDALDAAETHAGQPDALDAAETHAGQPHALVHEVDIEPGSMLARIVEAERMAVNSTHHQAVKKVGGGLRVVARSPGGIIEALESKSDAFLLAVQWHPERLAAGHSRHLALFAALIEASLEEPDLA